MKLKIIFFILVWFLSFSSSANEPLFKNITIQQSCEPNNFYNSYIRFASNGENHIAIQSSQIIINTSIKRKGNIIKFYFESTKDLGRGGFEVDWGNISKSKEVLILTILDKTKGVFEIEWHGIYNKKTQQYSFKSLFQIEDPIFRSCVLNDEGEWEYFLSPFKDQKLQKNIAPSKCLNEVERYKVQAYVDSSFLNNKTEANKYVPYFNCKKPYSDLEKYVCLNKDILLMFQAETFANKYGLENALKQKFDHKGLSSKEAKRWNSQFNKSNFSQLCDELKRTTSGALGSGSPYQQIYSKNSMAFYLKNNQHGIMLLQSNEGKIYLGNSCDAQDSSGKKGRWYGKNSKVIIHLEEEIIIFDSKDINMRSERCLESVVNKHSSATNQLQSSIKTTKQELDTTPPKNVEIITTEKAEPIKSASGSTSLVFLSMLGLLGWKFNNI